AFTPVDIGYCALLVAVWAVKQYVGAFLGAKAKGRAESKPDDKMKRLEQKYAELEKYAQLQNRRVEQLEERLDRVVATFEALDSDPIAIAQARKEDLIVFLGELGLTQRKAVACADDLHLLLETEIKPIFTPGVKP
ncbi:MAG: hypothetical protein M0036_24680, partial [Desulfobacteraceae bacterium]|nr:hypothetical protein [Desulfobacteraceae bacterium]